MCHNHSSDNEPNLFICVCPVDVVRGEVKVDVGDRLQLAKRHDDVVVDVFERHDVDLALLRVENQGLRVDAHLAFGLSEFHRERTGTDRAAGRHQAQVTAPTVDHSASLLDCTEHNNRTYIVPLILPL